MRKQLINSVEKVLFNNDKTILLLGDIGVFGFRNAFQNYSDRVYNIGILEQSTISLASGMAITGLIPIVHTIAPFIVERALEQLKIDFGYQELGGNFITVGASYDYAALGPTHHCPADVSLLLTIPNMEIIVPGTSNEFDQLFNIGYNNNTPTYYRLSEFENNVSNNVTYGKGNIIKIGFNGVIVCIGNMLSNVIEATRNLDITILYYTSINPFDSDLLLNNYLYDKPIIVIEPFYEGSINYKITKTLEGKNYKLFNIGVPHKFLKNYGTKLEHDEHLGLDIKGLKNKIEQCLI